MSGNISLEGESRLEVPQRSRRPNRGLRKMQLSATKLAETQNLHSSISVNVIPRSKAITILCGLIMLAGFLGACRDREAFEAGLEGVEPAQSEGRSEAHLDSDSDHEQGAAQNLESGTEKDSDSQPKDSASEASSHADASTSATSATSETSSTFGSSTTEEIKASDAVTVTVTPIPTETALPVPPYAVLAAQRASANAPVWGIQFGLEDLPDRQARNLREALPSARAAGIRAVRTGLRWDRIEPTNREVADYDWSESDQRLAAYAAQGVDSLVTLVAYPAWATEYQCGGALLPGMEAEWRQFVRAAVERYSRAPYRVVAWEIGNEVDGESIVREDDHSRPAEWGGSQPTTPYGGCWGGRAPAYAEFLRAAYEEAKAVHPDIPVTLGGLAFADVNGWFDMSFLDALLASGGGAYFDFLGYHWFANLRDSFPDLPSGPDKLRQLDAILAGHGASMPIWLTETYRFSNPGDRESRARQVDFLSKELVEVMALGRVERVYWYGWVDFPASFSTSERGLVDEAYQAKPALSVLPHIIELAKGPVVDLSSEDFIAYRFAGANGGRGAIIAWSRHGADLRFAFESLDEAEKLPTGQLQFIRIDPNLALEGTCCEPQNGAGLAETPDLEVGRNAVIIRTFDPGP